MTLLTTRDVAIVGAGPAGIGTAVALERLDVEYVVLERDRIGASFRQWPAEMRPLTPSFPANAFGVRDLNAITTDTSPALALDCEHPTGDQCTDYLEDVAEFHELALETDVDVEAVVSGSESATDPSDAADPRDGIRGRSRTRRRPGRGGRARLPRTHRPRRIDRDAGPVPRRPAGRPRRPAVLLRLQVPAALRRRRRDDRRATRRRHRSARDLPRGADVPRGIECCEPDCCDC